MFKKMDIMKVLFGKILPFACALVLLLAPSCFAQQKSGKAAVNGIEMYYAIHGEGAPLLLLHGGLGSSDMFYPILDKFTQNRTVITVDLHGHGRTALGNRELSIIDMGDDLAALLDELGYPQVDVVGYSLGAGAGFRLAVQHPEKVRKLVLISGGFARDGFYPEILEQQSMVNADAAEYMKETPMYQQYVKVAPNPDEFPRLLQQIGEYMSKDFNWADDVKKLKMPVMLIFGDSDMYRPEHMVEFYKLLGGGLKDAGWMRENMSQNRLAILPNLTHYDIFLAPELVRTALPFLNDTYDNLSWQ